MTETPEPTPGLPDDVVAVLVSITDYDDDEYVPSAVFSQARQVLDDHGVQFRSREQIEHEEHKATKRRLYEAQGQATHLAEEVARLSGVVQSYGAMINTLKTKALAADAARKAAETELAAWKMEHGVEEDAMPGGAPEPNVDLKTPSGREIAYTPQEF